MHIASLTLLRSEDCTMKGTRNLESITFSKKCHNETLEQKEYQKGPYKIVTGTMKKKQKQKFWLDSSCNFIKQWQLYWCSNQCQLYFMRQLSKKLQKLCIAKNLLSLFS